LACDQKVTAVLERSSSTLAQQVKRGSGRKKSASRMWNEAVSMARLDVVQDALAARVAAMAPSSVNASALGLPGSAW
jgi:hypothetical protein